MCGCGSFESGFVHYDVESGQGCCSGKAGSLDTIGYYEMSEGAWVLVRTKMIQGSTAQSMRCRLA